jgi:broad specificity phosphatase PhoE
MRHALTDWNERGLVMGQTDIHLSARGLRQVEDALDRLKLFGADALYCSSMHRCRQTADILAGPLGLSVKAVGGLDERSWGVFEGRHRSERDLTDDPPGGETYKQFRDRVFRALSAIDESAQKPLVITHSGVIRVALESEAGSAQDVSIPHLLPVKVNV